MPMHATLSTTFIDSRAAALSWVTGLPPQPALARRVLDLAGTRADLRVLGASHQFLLASEHGCLSETVACVPGRRAALPARAARREDGWDYAFEAVVRRYDDRGFAERAGTIARGAAAHPGGLTAAYPGLPYAVTAVVAERHGDAVTWTTWHTYPQENRIVTTRGRAVPAGPGPAESRVA